MKSWGHSSESSSSIVSEIIARTGAAVILVDTVATALTQVPQPWKNIILFGMAEVAEHA